MQLPRMILTAFVLTLLLTTFHTVLASSGGGGVSAPPAAPIEEKTPEQIAAENYHEGLRLRDKAWKLEEKAEAESKDAARAKLQVKVEKSFEKAADRFRRALEINPKLHQAWSSLGYALRRTGDYEASLEAYDRALALAPHYAEAVEYRAEAYLALGRLDEVKKAYIFLFSNNRVRADELMTAMTEWVETRRQDPGDLAAEHVAGFAEWVEERAEVAQQVSDLRTNARAWRG